MSKVEAAIRKIESRLEGEDPDITVKALAGDLMYLVGRVREYESINDELVAKTKSAAKGAEIIMKQRVTINETQKALDLAVKQLDDAMLVIPRKRFLYSDIFKTLANIKKLTHVKKDDDKHVVYRAEERDET